MLYLAKELKSSLGLLMCDEISDYIYTPKFLNLNIKWMGWGKILTEFSIYAFSDEIVCVVSHVQG